MAAEPSVSAVGTLLNGTYRLVRIIAEGGMGVVWEAEHVRLPRRFAVKVLGKPVAMTAAMALARFRREAEIASTLAHPHIVEVFDYQVSEGGAPYLVMEKLEGEDLADRLRKSGRMSIPGALRVLAEVAEALDVAHAAGVVHRDLKPANIFLTKRSGRDDFVKVLDFGVSKVIDAATLTTEKAMVGTPLYMSPEQAVGTQDLTPESDVFSLGAIAYEVLTGRRAFAASSIPSILFQIVHGSTPTVAGRAPGIGPEVDEVFARVLAKKKKDRYPRASQFAAELARALHRPITLAGGLAGAPTSEPIIIEEVHQPREATGASRTEVDSSTNAGGAMEPAGGDGARDPDATPLGARSSAVRPRIDGDGSGTGQRAPSLASFTAQFTGGRRRGVLIVAAVLAAALFALALQGLLRSRRVPAAQARSTAASLPAPGAAAPATPSFEPDPIAPAHEDVQFTFHVVPRNADITVDDQRVVGQRIILPWRKKPREVKVAAQGFRAIELKAPATEDRTFEMRLERVGRAVSRAAPPPERPAPTHKAAPVQDL